MIAKRARLLMITALAVAPSGASSQIADIRQGTNISIALSPDGASLVVDLLGGLWTLPATGGGAVALLPAGSGVAQPRFDRDGKRIVVQRWLDGQWDLWLFDLATSEWRALTTSPYDEREPEFSADMSSVLFAADPTGWFTLWELDLGDGALRQLVADNGHSGFPTVADTGELAYVNVDRGVSTLRLFDGRSGGTEIFRSEHQLAAPSWRPGGRVIAFDEIDATGLSTLRMLVLADEPVIKPLSVAEDVFVGRAAWRSPGEVIYAADGQIWRRGIGAVTRTPLHLFAAVGVAPTELASSMAMAPLDAPGPHRATGILGATTARDGAITAFAALGDLWVADRRGVRRLTDDPALDAFPNFSADEETLVFVSDRGGVMDLWQMTLANGVVKQLTGDSAKPFALSIAPSGAHVVYLETEGFGPWSESALQLLDLASPYRPTTIARGLYAAQGLRFAEASGAVEIHLEASREPAATRRETLTFKTDLVAAAPAEPAPIANISHEAAPQWTPLASPEAYVVEVGRLFDGVRNDYLRHMDIHVDGQRITAIVPRGSLPKPGKVFDARDAAIYPGLIDVHVHQSAAGGERLGRMWLLNGVTTVREITDDVSDALERAESWASGRRWGPRLLISPIGISDGIVTGGMFTLNGGPQPAPGFGHLLYTQQLTHSLPGLALRAPLRELVEPADSAAVPYLRISPGGATYQDTLAMLLASQTTLSTGFAALNAWPGRAAGSDPQWTASLAALFSPGELGVWMRGESIDPRVIAPLTATVARIVRGSGRVTITSDAPAVPYGYGVHAELALLAAAGIPNDQVLRIASAGGAIALGLGRELGTLETGKLADFVVVRGDPLARIADSATIIATVRGGVWLTREELEKRPGASVP
jgi:imidazolonepropionase-like amidohydrolase/Tol biopolymer transport system component